MGDLHAIEICISKAPRWHAKSALKGLKVDGIRTLTFVCKSLKDTREIGDAIGELDPSGSYKKRLQWAILEDFFREK